MVKWFLSFGLLFWMATSFGQNGSNLQISLLTCDQGDELYSTFGHSAIRILDKKTSRDQVYNYGTFDFDTPGFFIKFLRGKLPYSLQRSSYGSFLYQYRQEKRGVEENVLQLTNREKLKLHQLLEINLLPENRYYPYDFFFDNCATRILDVVPKAIDGQVTTTMKLDDKTFRDLLHEHLTGMPWSAFGIDLIIGATADHPATNSQATFLPRYLQDYFLQAEVEKQDTTHALVGETYQVLSFDALATKRKEAPIFTPYLAFGFLVLLEMLFLFFFRDSAWLDKWHKILFTTVGMASLLMLFLWFFTDHQACRPNWNLVWAHPLYLVFPFMSKGIIKMGWRILILLGIGIAIINTLYQFLPQYFNPYNLGAYTLLLLMLWCDQRNESNETTFP